VTGGQSVGGRFDAATRAIMPSQGSQALHLLRHGEVQRFTERRVRGHLDEPVSAAGLEQHARLAAWFARHHEPPELLLSSDLRRCRELGERLAVATGATLRLDPRLREQSMGAWEGRSWEELTRADPAGVTAWWDGYAQARAPGGESLQDLAARLEPLWDEIVRGGARRVALVTHIGVIRVLLCRLLGRPLEEALRWAPAAASHTSLTLAEAGAVLQSCGERPWLRVPDDDSAAPLGSAPRVALSGSAGTGKTTLGRRLAEDLGVPFIAEGMRLRLESGLDLHHLSLRDIGSLLAELWQEQLEQEDAAQGGFVADRSAADFAAFWIHYGLIHDAERTEPWMESTLARLARYDRVLLCPWGVLPLTADGVRSTNRWTQFQFQCTVEALLARHAPPGRLLRVPPTDDLSARLALIRARLSRRP
jgi:broad specificity phosphatase PhoE/nicotinamide riboside kinase